MAEGYFQIDSNATLHTNANGQLVYANYGRPNHPNPPSEFWSNVAADGSDIEVKFWDGSTETSVNYDLISFDNVAEEIELHFDGSNSTGGSSNAYRIYAGSGSAPSNTPSSVWGSIIVHALNEAGDGTTGEYKDRGTGGVDATGGPDSDNPNAPDRVAGMLGDGQDFNGTDEAIATDSQVTTNDTAISVSVWLNPPVSGQSSRSMVYGVQHPDGSTGSPAAGFRLDGTTLQAEMRGGGLETIGHGISLNTDILAHLTYDGSTMLLYVDGAQENSVNASGIAPEDGRIVWGSFYNKPSQVNNRRYEGLLDHGKVHNGTVLSAGYITTEFNNQSNSSFWSAGTWNATGGGATEVSFSLDASQNIASSSTSVAEAGISLNADADVSDGSTATGESDLTLPHSQQAAFDKDSITDGLFTVSHSQQAFTESTSTAEGAFSLSNLLQAAFDKQSVTDASFTLPTVHQVTTVSDTQQINEASFSLALQKAISTEQISTIEVSYSLNATQQAAISSDSTGEAGMALNLNAGLSLLSTALAEAGISFNAVQSLTLSGQTVGVEVTLSDGRTLTIKLQNRTLSIPDDNRTFTINAENRTLNIEP